MGPDIETHTLPMALMVVLVALGIAALVLLYRRKQQLQDAVEQQFRGFREKAIALMDRLDALRERHRTLPATDPDFTAPMAGSTLALYNAVETDLNLLWERWLEVMELWDHAQKLVRSGSGLAVRQAEEARKLLEQGHVDDLLRQSASCKDRLDRLNRAHEDARDALAAGRGELASLRSAVEDRDGPRRRPDLAADGLDRLRRLLDQAEGLLVADPVGASEIIVRTRRSLAEPPSRPGIEPEPPPARYPTYRLRFRPAPYEEPTWQPAESPFGDLAAAAERFRSAAARLRLTNLLGLFVRFWMIVWGISLALALLGPLIPLLIVGFAFLLILGGFWVIWQVVTFWFWYAMWGMRR